MTTTRSKLTPRLALMMAAPHTWVASMLPVLLTGALVWRRTGRVNGTLLISLLCVCVLMQSAVNTLNDYYDYLRGTDRPQDWVKPDDAVLVHYGVAPRQALLLGFGFLTAAAALAVYPVLAGGHPVLLIGLTGAGILFWYSAGSFPLSALPAGELVSGAVMGGLIPLGCAWALTGGPGQWILAGCLPLVLGIGLIMMTNNTCDIERDLAAGRRTLAGVLGRPTARRIYRGLLLCWAFALAGSMAWLYPPTRTGGRLPLWVLEGVVLLLTARGFFLQWQKNMEPEGRPSAMLSIVKLNALSGAAYLVWLWL